MSTDHDKERDQQITDWLGELSDAAVPPSGPHEDETAHALHEPPAPMLPALDRERPERPPQIPKAAWITLASVLGALAVAAVVLVALSMRARVEVPSLVGTDLGIARTTLGRVDLELRVSERRFSEQPEGQVLSQSPAPGTIVHRGDTVAVIVSAGTEEITLPDVIGDSIDLARGTLVGLGLGVEIEEVVSDYGTGTVVATTPSAGSKVRSGQIIRVQVAVADPTGGGVRPYVLAGVGVIIDPATVTGMSGDPTLEIGRRLRSLLEAAGANVTMLRSRGDTGTNDAARAVRAAAATGTVAVGLSVASAGPGGRVVSWQLGISPSAGTTSSITIGAQLGSKIASELALVAPPVRIATGQDTVLSVKTSDWVRVTLGSKSDTGDISRMADPRWADSVARAIYTAIGKQYGTPVTP